MNIVTKEIPFAATTLQLTNQRAIYWPSEHILILSDLHLGKSAHFRKHGIAMPTDIGLHDLLRLQQLISHFQVKKVLIVGDLIHAGTNTEVLQFKDIMALNDDVQMVLIKGNHDRLSQKKLHDLGIHEIHDTLKINDIDFVHQHSSYAISWHISGHTHPGVRIKMPSRGYMKLPCFVCSPQQIILPAFSHFTGLDTSLKIDNASFYALSEEGIFAL